MRPLAPRHAPCAHLARRPRRAPLLAARAAAFALGGAAIAGCLDPTEAIVDIKTNAVCTSVWGTGITAGKDASVETAPFDTTTDQCSDGEIGSIVLFPDGARDGPLVFKVVTSLAPTPVEGCVAPFYGPNCIVARRSMSFVEHRPFHVPLSLKTACAGVLCPTEQTCVDGTCVSATIDPETCDEADGCDPGANPILPWQQQIGGPGSQMARRLARGADGRLLVTGNFDGSLQMGSSTLKSKGGNDLFVASLSAGGEVEWARSFGGTGDDEGASVAVSPTGDVYVLGVFEGVVDFGGDSATSQGDWDIVLAKLGAGGEYAWSTTFGSPGMDPGTKVTVGEDGNVYISGSFAGTMSVQGTKLVPQGADAFVASFTPDGDLRWVKSIGGPEDDAANAIAVTSTGQVFVGGSYRDSMQVGSTKLQSAGSGDAFLASFDASGGFLWARSFGSVSNDLVLDLAARGDRMIATGAIAAAADFDGQPLGGGTDDDGFVIAVDLDGALQWSHAFGGQGLDVGSGVNLTNDGTIFLAGAVFEGPVFGAPTVGGGVRHPFVAVLEPSGDPRWVRQLSTSSWADATGIAGSPDGRAILAGWFTGSLALDEDHSFDSNGAEDMFLARIAPP